MRLGVGLELPLVTPHTRLCFTPAAVTATACRPAASSCAGTSQERPQQCRPLAVPLLHPAGPRHRPSLVGHQGLSQRITQVPQHLQDCQTTMGAVILAGSAAVLQQPCNLVTANRIPPLSPPQTHASVRMRASREGTLCIHALATGFPVHACMHASTHLVWLAAVPCHRRALLSAQPRPEGLHPPQRRVDCGVPHPQQLIIPAGHGGEGHDCWDQRYPCALSGAVRQDCMQTGLYAGSSSYLQATERGGERGRINGAQGSCAGA